MNSPKKEDLGLKEDFHWIIEKLGFSKCAEKLPKLVVLDLVHTKMSSKYLTRNFPING